MLDDKKKIYGQAFCIYALAEYYRTFDEPPALKQAVDVFDLIEAHASDRQYGGYFEVMSRDWQPCEDMRLSDKDMNEKKSMNNHLHVLEGYTNLVRVSHEPRFADRLRDLIELFRRHIVNSEQTHFQHFFDEAWTPRSDSYTFGHDIEGSWLLCEAAEVARRPERLLKEVQSLAVKMARAVLEEGLDSGRWAALRRPRRADHQSEQGMVAAGRGGRRLLERLATHAATRPFARPPCGAGGSSRSKIVDHEHGEWFWCVRPDGTPDPAQPKVSAWKGPYHNGRCCLEIISRTYSR